MRWTIFSLFLFVNFTASAQLWVDFRISIYECIDSFYTKNPLKHKEITGVGIVTDLEGNLISYALRFKDKSVTLSKREYKWLFRLLNRENYKKYEKVYNSEEELKGLEELKYGIKYLPIDER